MSFLLKIFLFSAFVLSVLGSNKTSTPAPTKNHNTTAAIQNHIKTKTIIGNRNETNYRLPNNTIPLLYQIKIVTNVHNGEFNFTGELNVTLKAMENTSYITIHKKNVTIIDYKLLDKSNKLILTNVAFDNLTEKLTINISSYASVEHLIQGETYRIEMSYKGVLGDDDKGFYRSSYVSNSGYEVWLAATQFEPTSARNAFPCYDEPGIRADYDISIVHGKNYHAISNMPIKDKLYNGNTTTTIFQRIKNMQPYLVAFVVSDFYYVSLSKTGLVPQTVFARPSYVTEGRADFSVSAGQKILTFLEKYFKTKFSLPKMDQVALPRKSGAMENWGLATYAEDMLLYDYKSTGLKRKSHIVSVVAHEFAHQFFGNLVAPLWWNYVWLNEGFATFYQYKITQLVYPEFRTMDLFIIEVLQKALHVDALNSTRPMTHYVEAPDAIANQFDDVAYQKSASVLRMLEHAVSEKTWKKGLNQYLSNMQYKAATSDDLAKYLDEAVKTDKKMLPSNFNMKDILNSWSKKSGYPLVTVTLGADNKLKLTQSPFTYDCTKKVTNRTWIIPINIAVAKKDISQFFETSPLAWMTSDTLTLEQKQDLNWTTLDWIILNKQQTGFYRVNYDENLWKLISEKLNSNSFEEIHHKNRAQIIDDIFSLARVGKVSYSTALKLVLYLKQEIHFTPWLSMVREFEFMKGLLHKSICYKNLTKFFQKLIEPTYTKLGVYDKGPYESVSNKYLRSLAISVACSVPNSDCNKNVLKRFTQIIQNETLDIEPDLQYNIYCKGMETAGKEDYEAVWNRFNKTKFQRTRKVLLMAIGCTTNPLIQQKFLKSILNDTKKFYSKQEKLYVLHSVFARSHNGLDSTIKFIETLYKNLTNEFNTSDPIIKVLDKMAEVVVSQKQYEAFESLIKKLVEEKYMKIERKIEILYKSKQNLEWIQTYSDEIGRYLKSYSSHAVNIFVSLSFPLILFMTHMLVTNLFF